MNEEQIKWFMELAIEMKSKGYSNKAIFTIDLEAWEEYRIGESSPEEALAEDESYS